MRTQTYPRFVTLFALASASAALFGCSSSSTAPISPEVETGVVDTGVKDTAKADLGPTTCPAPLPTTYACPAPKKPAAGTSCTTADVQAYFTACLGASSTNTTCAAFAPSVASCGTCLDSGWVRPDSVVNSAACMLTIDPTATDCANVDECDDDCTNVTCWNTGICADGTAAQACNDEVTAPGGACATFVNQGKLASCRAQARFAPCDWTAFASDADTVKFLQGACQYGGSWTTTTSDAGTDAPSSETSTDAATGDAGTDATTSETSTDAAAGG